MRPTGAKRVLFIVCTIGFVAALSLLLAHRSEHPVALGRYSAKVVFLGAVFAAAYGAIAYACWCGLERFGQTYLALAANFLGFVLLMLGVNLTATVATYFARPDTASGASTPGEGTREKVHAELIGLDAQSYYQFRSEQGWAKSIQYEPWVGFKEAPREGRYINVSPEGFRQTRGTPKAPRNWVFLIGGSTTFGYGVRDDQTIASYLQAKLTELYGENTFGVRNFGRAYYYSAQEFILLWSLLEKGARPNVVIFIDGMNEGQISPYYVPEMRAMFDHYQEQTTGTTDTGSLLAELAMKAPIYPYIHRLYQSMAGTPPEERLVERPRPNTTAADIAAQYEASNENIRLLTARYNVTPFFVVQPMPGYRNDQGIHTFRSAPPDSFNIDVLERLAVEADKHPDRMNLTGLLADYRKQAFVDRLHYSPDVHKLIADAISDHVASVLEGLARR